MINYNLCVGERVGKKERTKYNLIKAKSLRKKKLQLDESKGESEREIKKEVKWREREREKQWM